MAPKKKKSSIVLARQTGAGRIRLARDVAKLEAPKGYNEISSLDGYDPSLPSRPLKIMFDEDATVLRGLLVTQINSFSVEGSDLAGKDDIAILSEAKRQGRILLTFNHRDFIPDRRGMRANDCGGLIALKGANSNGERTLKLARIVDEILMQVGMNVRKSWWAGTKISVSGTDTIIKRAGEQKYKAKLDSRGVIWIKPQRKR